MGVTLSTYADALACLAAFSLFCLLALTGARTTTTRILTLLTLTMAVNTLAAPLHLVPGLADDRTVAYNLRLWNLASAIATPFIYVAFAAAAIPARMLRPLRGPRVRIALLGCAALGVPFTFLAHSWALNGGEIVLDGHPAWVPNLGFYFTMIVAALVSFLLPLAAAIQAYRDAPAGSASKAASKRYLSAFVLFDASTLGIVLSGGIAVLFLVAFGIAPADANDTMIVRISGALYLTFTLAQLLAIFLIARAVMRDQLVDFDLRVKWTLHRGTLAAIFVGVFFIVVAIAEQYLQRYGVIAGGIAVGILLFALRPLERLAQRLADTAMPTVQDSAEYRTTRRREIYRAALESALADGTITDKERAILATLADELGVGAVEALEIERDVAKG